MQVPCVKGVSGGCRAAPLRRQRSTEAARCRAGGRLRERSTSASTTPPKLYSAAGAPRRTAGPAGDAVRRAATSRHRRRSAPPGHRGGGKPALLPRRGHRCYQRRIPPRSAVSATRRTAAPGPGRARRPRAAAEPGAALSPQPSRAIIVDGVDRGTSAAELRAELTARRRRASAGPGASDGSGRRLPNCSRKSPLPDPTFNLPHSGG